MHLGKDLHSVNNLLCCIPFPGVGLVLQTQPPLEGQFLADLFFASYDLVPHMYDMGLHGIEVDDGFAERAPANREIAII